MPASDATAFPVQDQAFRFYWRIPVTGGLAGLGAQISKDGANFVNTSSDPHEILQSDNTTASGYGWLDLTAAEMNCFAAVVRIFCTNAGGYEVSQQIVGLNMTEPTTDWADVGQIRIENVLLNIVAACINQDQFVGGTHTIMRRNITKMLQGTYTETTGGDATRGAMS